jgi:thiamine monophosphate synthase
MSKALSKWRASTGKYDVIVWRDEGSDYNHFSASTRGREIREATELCAFINDNYDLAPSALASAILENYLGAVEVEVRDFNRNAIILKRVYGTSDI